MCALPPCLVPVLREGSTVLLSEWLLLVLGWRLVVHEKVLRTVRQRSPSELLSVLRVLGLVWVLFFCFLRFIYLLYVSTL